MNVALLWLTKLYLRSIGGKFVRTEVIRLLGAEDQEVVVFFSDKSPLLGQVTFLRTTIVHESVFRSKHLLDYVIAHETRHKKQWYVYFIYPIIIVCVFAAFFLMLAAVWSLLASIIYMNPGYLLGTFFGLVFAVLSSAIFGLCSWTLELNADFYAIKKLGLQAFLNALADAPKPHKRSFYLRAIILLTHPPANVTIRVYHWTHRKPQ